MKPQPKPKELKRQRQQDAMRPRRPPTFPQREELVTFKPLG